MKWAFLGLTIIKFLYTYLIFSSFVMLTVSQCHVRVESTRLTSLIFLIWSKKKQQNNPKKLPEQDELYIIHSPFRYPCFASWQIVQHSFHQIRLLVFRVLDQPMCHGYRIWTISRPHYHLSHRINKQIQNLYACTVAAVTWQLRNSNLLPEYHHPSSWSQPYSRSSFRWPPIS